MGLKPLSGGEGEKQEVWGRAAHLGGFLAPSPQLWAGGHLAQALVGGGAMLRQKSKMLQNKNFGVLSNISGFGYFLPFCWGQPGVICLFFNFV